jgi:hypothetical protein
MTGRITTQRNTVAAAMISENQTTVPTQAEFVALNTGITPMKIRRVFGSFRRAMTNIFNYAAETINAAPVLANALVNQSVNEGAALSYQFASNTFSDAQALTYTATLSNGAALPGWLTFTAATRTFSGTAPTVASNTVLTVRVAARDTYGREAAGTFTITIVNL